MPYSYTEKKRIRKNFGTFAQVMDLPNLIETQTNSYAEFLQADVAPEARKKQGLEEVFQSLFPIKSVSGNAALEDNTRREKKYHLEGNKKEKTNKRKKKRRKTT